MIFRNRLYTIVWVAAALFLFVSCNALDPEPEEIILPTVTATSVPAPTETVTALPSETPKPTVIPSPTPEPTIAPMREFLSDLDRIAAVYPDSVEIIRAENAAFYPNSALGISLELPVLYALQVQSNPEERSWELIGGGLEDGRLLSISIGVIPSDFAPGLADVEGFNAPNSASSLSSSLSSFEFDDGFGVLFTELYSYKGHYGTDVVYTLVLEYDEDDVVGIQYFLSEEIFDEVLISGVVEDGFTLVNQIQESFTQFEFSDAVLRQNEYRILTGICPTDSDETYGFTEDNPIRMTSAVDDPVGAALLGPVLAGQFFETLLFDGQPVSYVRLGSIATDETILDQYQIIGAGLAEPILLYVDQYSSAPYKVPAGFECVGILNPEYLIEFED
ncbi:MAG: hypothetical protein V2J07_07285 [Anaerolineae bacterium]|jgi:hypothetical protein|nr:hypothetical protein [Anaerolineae bacterium]